jgi:hypothetical protein
MRGVLCKRSAPPPTGAARYQDATHRTRLERREKSRDRKVSVPPLSCSGPMTCGPEMRMQESLRRQSSVPVVTVDLSSKI